MDSLKFCLCGDAAVLIKAQADLLMSVGLWMCSAELDKLKSHKKVFDEPHQFFFHALCVISRQQ